MREDWIGGFQVDRKRDVSLILYPEATWPELLANEPSGAALDLTAHVASMSQDGNGLRAVVRWQYELNSPARPGTLCRAIDNTTEQTIWTGSLASIASTESRGERASVLTFRTRDALPLWRRNKWTSDIYPVGTDVAVIAGDIMACLGLQEQERPTLQPFGRTTPHSNTQLADMAAWDMLETLLFPVSMQPWVDALGRFKPISRDVTRPATFVLTKDQVVSIGAPEAQSPTTGFILKWLDKNLTESLQQDQVLATASIVAGFFKQYQHARNYWSKDRMQRAKGTYMKILASVNDGLVPVGTEVYEQISEFEGRITVTTADWVPALLVYLGVSYLYAASIGDAVVSLFGGYTIPVGSLAAAICLIGILLVMMCMGTGSYEIWGQPFDYVHAVNTTEAYADGVREWERVEETVTSDYVTDEAHAQGIATTELLYRYLSAYSLSAEVLDNPAVEPGDILELPGGTRLYVKEPPSRDLSRGAAATMTVTGFQV